MHEDVRSVHSNFFLVPVNTSFSVVNLLVLPQLSDSCIPRLVDFLTHQYPTVWFLLRCSQICGLMLAQSLRFGWKQRDSSISSFRAGILGRTQMTSRNCCWRQSGLLIDVRIVLRADFCNINRFSSQTDVREKATIIVDELKKVKDE